MRGERSSTSPDMSRLVVLPPEHGASAYLNIRCRDERSGRECLQRGLNLTTNKRTKMGVRASPVRGRGGGCAEAPLAGLPPHGPPSLTQSAAEVAPTGATATRAGSSACIFVSGRCSLSVYRSGRTLSFAEPVVSMRRNPLRTHRPTVFVYFEANGHPCSFMSIMVAQTCGRKMRDFADPRFPGKDPALEWAFLGSGAAFYDQPARGSLRERATSSASPAR